MTCDCECCVYERCVCRDDPCPCRWLTRTVQDETGRLRMHTSGSPCILRDRTSRVPIADKAKLRIATAAVLVGDRVYTLPRPARHCDVMQLIVLETGERVPNDAEQGFLTECERFLRRKPAETVARRAGQVKAVKWPHLGLNSEDLW